jgi:hypothetical protein
LPVKGRRPVLAAIGLYESLHFAAQHLAGMSGPDLQTTMSVTNTVANEQVLHRNGSYFACLFSHSSRKVARICVMSAAAPAPYLPIHSMSQSYRTESIRDPCIMPACASSRPACAKRLRGEAASRGSSMPTTGFRLDHDKNHATDRWSGWA